MNLLITQMIVCLLIAFLLGGVLGWFLRTVSRKNNNDEQIWRQQAENRRTELMQLRTNLNEVEDVLSNANNELNQLRQLNRTSNEELQRKTRALEKAETELASVKAQLSQQEADFSALRSEAEINNSRLQGRYQSALDAQKSEIERLTRQVNTLQQQPVQAEPTGEHHEQIRQKDLRIVELEEANYSMMKRLEQADEQMLETQTELANARKAPATAVAQGFAGFGARAAQSTNTEQSDQRHDERLQALESQQLAHKAELLTRDRELAAAQETIEVLQSTQHDSEDELSDIIANLRRKELQLSDAKERMKAQDDELSLLRSRPQLASNDGDLEALRAQLSDQSAQFANLYNQCEEQEKTIAQLEHSLQHAKQQLNRSEHQEQQDAIEQQEVAEMIDQLSSENESLKTQNHTLQQTLDTLKAEQEQQQATQTHDADRVQELNILRDALDQSEKSVANLQLEHDKELEEVKSYVLEMESERESLEGKLHEYSQRILELRRETADMDQLKRELDALENARLELEQSQQSLGALQQERDGLQVEYNNTTSELTRARDELGVLRSSLAHAEQDSATTQALEQQVDRLRTHSEQLANALNDADNTAKARQQRIEQLEHALQEQQEQLANDNEKEQLYQQIRQRDHDIGELRSALTEAEQQRQALDDQAQAQNELKLALQQANEEAQAQAHKNQLLQASVALLKRDATQHVQQYDGTQQQAFAQLQQQHDAQSARVNELQDQLQSQVDAASQFAQHDDQQERLARLEAHYQERLDSLNTALNEQQQTLAQREHEMTLLRASIQQYRSNDQQPVQQAANDDTNEQALSALTQQLNDATQQNQQLEQELQTQADTIEALQARIDDLTITLDNEATHDQGEEEDELDGDFTLVDREQLDNIAKTLQGLQNDNEQSLSQMRQELEHMRQQLADSRHSKHQGHQAEWLPSNEPVEKPRSHYTSAQRHDTQSTGLRDDLQQVNGITPIIERLLNENGVYTYRDIASFTAEDIEAYSTFIDSLPGRIERDQWIAQAKYLHQLKYGVKL